MILTRRICLTIRNFLNWWSFPLFLWPLHLIHGWYCEEKLEANHSQGLKGLKGRHITIVVKIFRVTTNLMLSTLKDILAPGSSNNDFCVYFSLQKACLHGFCHPTVSFYKRNLQLCPAVSPSCWSWITCSKGDLWQGMSTRKPSCSSDKSHKPCQITNTLKEGSPEYLPVGETVFCRQIFSFIRELWQLPAATSSEKYLRSDSPCLWL